LFFLLQNYGVFITTALFCGSFVVAPQFNVNILPLYKHSMSCCRQPSLSCRHVCLVFRQQMVSRQKVVGLRSESGLFTTQKWPIYGS